MVPGVTFDREAFDGFADELNAPEQPSLDDQHPRQDDKRVGRRRGVRGNYFTNAFISDAECRRHQGQTNNERSKGFRFPMTIRMVCVRRFSGDFQAKVND